MFRVYLATLAWVICLHPGALLGDEAPSSTGARRARELTPIATLGVSRFENFESTLKGFFTGAGQEEQAEMVEGLIEQLRREDRVPGIDPHRPLGLFIVGDLENPRLLPFFPVSTEREFLALGDLFFPVRHEREGGIHELRGEVSSYLKFSGNYAFLSSEPGLLEGDLPDPLLHFPEEARRHEFALCIRFSGLPAVVKEQVRADLQERSLQAAVKRPGEGDTNFARRVSETQLYEQAARGLVDQGRHLILGGAIDPVSRRIDFQLGVHGRGRDLESLIQNYLGMRTRFGSLGGTRSLLSLSGAFPSEGYVGKSVLHLLTRVRERLRVSHSELMQDRRDQHEKLSHSYRGVLAITDLLGKRVAGTQLDLTLDLREEKSGAYGLAMGFYLPRATDVIAWLEEYLPLYADLQLIRPVEEPREHRGLKIFTIVPSLTGVKLPLDLFGVEPILRIAVGNQEVFLTLGEGGEKSIDRVIDRAHSRQGGTRDLTSIQFRARLADLTPVLEAVGGSGTLLHELGNRIGDENSGLEFEARATDQGASVEALLESGFHRLIAEHCIAPMMEGL